MSQKPLVLIVDDDQYLLELLEFNFDSEGYDVVCHGDGQEGLDYLRETNDVPDAIVLDLLMPDVDGMEFLRQRAEIDRLPQIPTIILTGIDDEETLAEAFELGVDDFVTKPFSPKALITRVNHLT